MKTGLLFVAGLISVSAQADVIKCTFTEPFISTTYSMAQQSLAYTADFDGTGEKTIKLVKNVSFQIKGAGLFTLVAKDGKILQTLKLTNKGSDGMSDTIYPYEVKDTDSMMTANVGIGGCTSNYQKSKEGQP